jgi:hypothetical protein
LPLPLPSSLPFSLPALGGCQILTLEAPLIAGKAPWMDNGYIYSKDDMLSPLIKSSLSGMRMEQRGKILHTENPLILKIIRKL